ncbi:hypothetical protein KQX54_010780 [Cotesia glomerata]|uniref:Uncharacterized protein n=1 Tax=Cotesia glomerata TaxID=32391 RepID=A0AAV7J366_COTGL|nr:hypothetical protein KQX54_010780 [Cotesia glomerata]
MARSAVLEQKRRYHQRRESTSQCVVTSPRDPSDLIVLPPDRRQEVAFGASVVVEEISVVVIVKGGGKNARRVIALPRVINQCGGEGRQDVGPPELVRPSSGRYDSKHGGMSRRKQARPSRANLEEDLVHGPLGNNPLSSLQNQPTTLRDAEKIKSLGCRFWIWRNYDGGLMWGACNLVRPCRLEIVNGV